MNKRKYNNINMLKLTWHGIHCRLFFEDNESGQFNMTSLFFCFDSLRNEQEEI